jgi:hypothetical protein
MRYPRQELIQRDWNDDLVLGTGTGTIRLVSPRFDDLRLALSAQRAINTTDEEKRGLLLMISTVEEADEDRAVGRWSLLRVSHQFPYSTRLFYMYRYSSTAIELP